MILKRESTRQVLAGECGHDMLLVSHETYPNVHSCFRFKTLKPQKLQVFTLEVTCCLFGGTHSPCDTLLSHKTLQNPLHKFINILYMHTVIHCGGKNENRTNH